MTDFNLYKTCYDISWIVYTSHGGDPNDNKILETSKQHYDSEVQYIHRIINSLPDDAVILDGGANLGYITLPTALLLKQTKPNAKIISIEAQRRLYYALAGSVALNDLYNVFPYNLALGEKITMAHMPAEDYSASKDFGSVHVSNTDSTEYNYLDPFNTPMVTIDSLKLPRLDFLKLDIEGYEPQALLGGLDTIKKHRPWIWAEYYDCVSIYNQDKIKEIVSQVPDYSFYYLTCDRQNMLCIPNEKRAGVNLDFLANTV